MNSHRRGQPFMALVDDDSHSARLMIRMLLAHGAPSVSWLDSEALASAELGKVLADSTATLPGLVIVDLNAPWQVQPNNTIYKCGWSPFDGTTFKSRITHTFVNGNLVYKNFKFNPFTKAERITFDR